MKHFYKGGRGLIFSRREGEDSFRKEKPPRLSKILTNQVRWVGAALPSATGRQVVDVSSKYPRVLFDTCSGAVREVFDCCSGATRRTVEAHPKQYRSCPEPVPKRTRSAPEGCPNSIRRNSWFFRDRRQNNLLVSYFSLYLCFLNKYRFSKRIFSLTTMESKSMPLALALICFMLFNLSTAWAQSAESRTAEGQIEIKPLEVGDTIPDVALKILNSERNLAQDRLHNYGGEKWIILEFWNTICGPCIAAMPHLFEIQTQLEDRIEVLPVTWEARERINLFFQNIRNTPMVAIQDKFRTAVEDSVLRKWFGQFSYPHTVVLDEKRIVRLITKPQYLSTTSLSELMDGKSNIVKNQLVSLDGESLFKTNSKVENEPKFVFYSGITSFVQGLTADYVLKLDSMAGTVHELIPNRSILNLYNSARLTDGSYPKGLPLHPQSRLLLVEEPHKFAYVSKKRVDLEAKLVWDQANCYNYELCLPYDLGDKENRRKRLGQDLDSFFGLKSQVTTATVPCLVICQSDKAEILPPIDTKGNKLLVIKGLMPNRLKEREIVVGPADSGALNYIRGLDFKELCTALQKFANEPLPVIINDLPTDVRFDIDFVSDSNSLCMLKNALENGGYKLVEGRTEVELFVIRDQDREESFDDLVFTPLGYLTRADWLNSIAD